MKIILTGLVALSFFSNISAHEIEGTLSFNGKPVATLPRTPISLSTSSKSETGRTYVLWLAPDGAIAFHINPELMKKRQTPLTNIWMINATKPATVPDGFDKAKLDKKADIDGVVAMGGENLTDWISESDYTIYMDAKGAKGKHSFKGFLYGSSNNRKISNPNSSEVPERDYKKEYKKYISLAKKGDDVAMISIGLLYHQGLGCKQNYPKAMQWYLRAFKKSNGDAFSNIGVMYRDGLGVKKNKKIAYCLFLLTNVKGLGTDSTQMRAGSCLGRISQEMTKEELIEVFNYTEEYIVAYVNSKGTLKGIPTKYKPSKKQLPLKKKNWWRDGELPDFIMNSK